MESSAQDEYVSDFDLEHLEEVVKREMLEQRRNAEAYAQHYQQNLQPAPPAAPSAQQVVVVTVNPSASSSTNAPPLKHQLQVRPISIY